MLILLHLLFLAFASAAFVMQSFLPILLALVAAYLSGLAVGIAGENEV